MANIEALEVFAKNGEKNTAGLTQSNGFPVALKPARQWFNWLFYSLTTKVNEIVEKINTHESTLDAQVDYVYPIGVVITFAVDFDPNAHFKGTTWQRFGDGQVLLTEARAGNTTAASWMFDLKNTGGADTVTLDIANLPPHHFEFTNTWAARADQIENLPAGATRIGDGDGHANDDVTDSLIKQETNTLGSGEPFSVVQNSIVIAAWERTA